MISSINSHALGGGPLTEKAYNQLVDIVRKDFSVPPTFTNAQAAGVRDVVTGLHGYRNPIRERDFMMGENPYRPIFATPPYMKKCRAFFCTREERWTNDAWRVEIWSIRL